ncbi:hypothetical protein HGA64_01910 [Candidatus Falkowbacteria bacterium]|nr:hypothetical protein [Candidatus Falkowbacteria bacterium]
MIGSKIHPLSTITLSRNPISYRPMVLPIADRPSFVDKSVADFPASRRLPKLFRIIGVNELKSRLTAALIKGGNFCLRPPYSPAEGQTLPVSRISLLVKVLARNQRPKNKLRGMKSSFIATFPKPDISNAP